MPGICAGYKYPTRIYTYFVTVLNKLLCSLMIQPGCQASPVTIFVLLNFIQKFTSSQSKV